MKISKEQVDKAKARYEGLLDLYLLERGWTVDEENLWSKGGVIGSGVLTNEEAYWEENRDE